MECFSYDDLNRLTVAFPSDEDTETTDDCSDGYVNVGLGVYDHSYDYNAIATPNSVDSNNSTYGAPRITALSRTSRRPSDDSPSIRTVIRCWAGSRW